MIAKCGLRMAKRLPTITSLFPNVDEPKHLSLMTKPQSVTPNPRSRMQQRTITITNRLGLHARAAAKLVRVATGFHSQVCLARLDARHQTADAKSIFNVLLLAAAQGTELAVSTEGADEVAALEALCALIADKFGEE